MTTEQLIITYVPQPKADAASVWLRLEQEAVPLSLRNATLVDMVQMFNRAVSGLSARSYQVDKCQAATIRSDGTIVITLDIFVWPSALDLPYTLDLSYGSVSGATPIEVEREVDVAVEGTASVTLPWLMDYPEAWWQLPCVNEFSEPVAAPDIAVSGSLVSLSASCYGVLRVRGVALGYRHTVTLEISKTNNTVKAEPETTASLHMATGYNGGTLPVAQEDLPTVFHPLGYAITSVNISLTAQYVDGNDETQPEIIPLKIPACVLDLLEYCPDGDLAAQDKILSGGSWSWDSENITPVVYYDTCTGERMEVHFVEDN